MPEAVRITLWLAPAPQSRPKDPASQESSNPEEPMVFQTVARLNLAAASQRDTSNAGAKDSAKDPSQADEGAPDGGQQ